jgi:hypothetical protein
MQGNGAEMLRLAACYANDLGVIIIATVHDSIMIEAYRDDIYRQAAVTIECMNRASREMLGGFELFVKPTLDNLKPIVYPHRYVEDDECLAMWNRVMSILNRLDGDHRQSLDILNETEANTQTAQS